MELFDHQEQKREVSVRCCDGTSLPSAGMIELARDFILPDSYADIKRILTVVPSLRPSGSYREGAKAYCSGEMGLSVVFVSDEGKICAVPFSMEYEGVYPLGSADQDFTVSFMPSVESVAARSVNPRKVGIKAKINPGLFVWERMDASVAFPTHLSRQDRESFEEKCEEIDYVYLTLQTLNGMESGDDIQIDPSSNDIGEVLFCDVRFSSVTAEAKSSGIAVNATADVTIAYNEANQEDNGALRFLSHSLPLSTLVSAEALSGEEPCTARLFCEKVSCQPAENAQGEKRIFELDFSYAVYALAEKKMQMIATKDLYSTRYECERTMGDIRISRAVGTETLSLRCTGEASFRENGEILGVLPSAKGAYLSLDEKGAVRLEGSLSVAVLIREEDGSVVSETVEAPFSAGLGLAFSQKPEGVISLSLDRGRALLQNGILSVEVPLAASILAWENKKENLVFSCTVTAELLKSEDDSFTVYFPSAGETLWDIAKKYKIPTSRLTMTGSESGAGVRRALILPPVKKTLFSGVID